MESLHDAQRISNRSQGLGGIAAEMMSLRQLLHQIGVILDRTGVDQWPRVNRQGSACQARGPLVDRGALDGAKRREIAIGEVVDAMRCESGPDCGEGRGAGAGAHDQHVVHCAHEKSLVPENSGTRPWSQT